MEREQVAEKFLEKFIIFVTNAPEASAFRNKFGKNENGLYNYNINYVEFNPQLKALYANTLDDKDCYNCYYHLLLDTYLNKQFEVYHLLIRLNINENNKISKADIVISIYDTPINTKFNELFNIFLEN